MNIPFDQFVKAVSARREAGRDAGGEVRLSVMVAQGADPCVCAAVRAALHPQTSTGRLYVAGFGPSRGMPAVNGLSDAAVVVCSNNETEHACELCRAFARAQVPCCAVVAADGGAAAAGDLADSGVGAGDILVVDAANAADALGSWLVGRLPDLAASLGASFACCRRAQARAVVCEAARNNALVGAVPVLDGADLPVMLATEVAMLFKMAEAYGVPLDWSRLREGGFVAACALALRGIARVASRRLPLPAPLVQAGVAAAGTYAVGRALMAYYESLAAANAVPGALRVEPLRVEDVPASACGVRMAVNA